MSENAAYDIVQAARSQSKIDSYTLINGVFSDFHELHGDRLHGDDSALIGGVGRLNGRPVTILATNKGRDITEGQATHFGGVSPDGYRKAIRLMKQSTKFNRPIVALINTPGAYPGVEAEYGGQGEAIARSIQTGLGQPVPYLSLIFGEAGSGGALALATGDEVWMLEKSTYSVVSPEGYASILWRDGKLADQAAAKMKLTPSELLAAGFVDRVLPEVTTPETLSALTTQLDLKITALAKLPVAELMAARRQRYRQF